MDISTPQVFSLHQMALHQLAKKIWGYLDVVPSNGCRTVREYIKLIAYKEKTLDTVLPLSGFPKSFKNLVAAAVWRLDQGYKEAWSWKRIYKRDIPIISLACGRYDAQNFIKPDGHFDDLAWAKVFVADETQNVLDRYKFACFYCFEDVLENQWHSIRSNTVLLSQISEITDPSLVQVWTFSLKNETKELPREIFLQNDFYVFGFGLAFLSGFEYAARFFWEHLSSHNKAKFLAQFHCADLVLSASRDSNGIVFFIFSLLPIEKKLFLATHANCKHCASIWHCLLHNVSSRELVINEIVSFPFISVSSNFCVEVLSGITSCMESCISNTQFYKLFKIIWSRVTQEKKGEILHHIKHSVLPRLAKINAFNLLEMIIKPLHHEVRDNILFAIRPNIYSFLSDLEDYGAQLKFFFLFIIDQNPTTKMSGLRTDASAFLNRCSKRDFIKCWSDSSFEKSGKRQYEELMECLQGSIEVLQQLLHQIDDMSCSTTAFEDASNLIGTDIEVYKTK